MNEPEKKRKRDGRGDGSPAAEEGGVIGVARDSTSMMAEMRAMLEQTRSRMARMQDEMDALERRVARVDDLERKCRAQEERCVFLEARCDSLQRSVRILAKNQNWEYSAPAIPTAYWTERGFGDQYIHDMEEFINEMKHETHSMREDNEVSICLGHDYYNEVHATLLHDEALLPHWKEFTDALQLSAYSGHFSIGKIQFPSDVFDMLAPALATKKITSLGFGSNDFENASDGIQFITTLIKNNHHLEDFEWVDNPIIGINQVDDILKVLISHPRLNTIRLRNSLGPDVNGYDALCSLLTSGKNFLEIDLESSNILTNGRIDIPDFLATNPPLQYLYLAKNNLDDDDAVLIADSLKLNTNLQQIGIGENNMTHRGHDALRNAIFDTRGLNYVAECNHTCCLGGIDEPGDFVGNRIADANRAKKLYFLLSLKYKDGSIVNDLDEEFGDGALKFAPNVLERVHTYSRYSQPNPYELLLKKPQPAQPLSIVYEILRGWKMPELYENHTRNDSKKGRSFTKEETKRALGAVLMTDVEEF